VAGAGLNQAEMRKLLKELGKLDVKLQKKVFTQSINATTRKVVLPAVKAKINARSIDVPMLPYGKRGLKKPMQSHTSAPGALKRAMKVRAIKRTRKAVGRLVATPHRPDLEIPKDYPGYYPAFLEFGSAPLSKPRPYLRGTFEENMSKIESFFLKESRRRMKTVYRGR
jgi:hypothetical protein